MKTLKIILASIGVLIALILIVALFVPKNKTVKSDIVIKSHDYIVFEQVNNFKNWVNWAPFFEEDTAMASTYEGPESGNGAVWKWQGPVNGNGSITITESIPFSKIISQLVFMEEGKSASNFYFDRTDGGIKVTWSIEMTNLSYPVERIFSLFMNGMMQNMFSKGLNKLKGYCESIPVKYYATSPIEKPIEAQTAIVIRDSVNTMNIGEKMGIAYGKLMETIRQNRLEMAGMPFCLCYEWCEGKNNLIIIGLPVNKEIKVQPPVEMYKIPASNGVMVSYFGSYENTGYGHIIINNYIKANNKEITGPSMEVYITDPQMEPDPVKWETQIYYPVK